MKTKSKNKLKIFAGVGAAHEVSADVAAEYSGSVGDALSDLIAKEIRDPQLRDMLNDSRVALELYGGAGDGDEVEENLSPAEDWKKRVINKLQEEDLEIGIARSHEGGQR